MVEYEYKTKTAIFGRGDRWKSLDDMINDMAKEGKKKGDVMETKNKIIFGAVGLLEKQEIIPTEATLPFLMEKDNVNITFLNLTVGKRISGLTIEPEEDHNFVILYIKYKNNGHKELWSSAISLSGIELETDRNNLYWKSGGLYRPTSLKPEEETVIFCYYEIMEKESPFELRVYEFLDGENKITYLIKI